jgi:lysophospholipase L1-like esterase
MLTRRSFFAVAACTLALPLATTLSTQRAAAQPAGDFFFHDGDRAMILGDSITEQRMYPALIESYVLSRFPQWNITFRNTGWSGDTMGLRTRGGQDNGFKRDLAPLQPTAVTIDFGMNDARAGNNGYDAYVKNAQTLADKFAAIGTRVAFVTSSPEERYQENQPAGSAYNLMLRKYSDGLKNVAAEKNDLFVDQLNPMIATIEAGRAAGVLSKTEGGPRLIPDGVHPNWAGHLVMATNILKGLRAPSLVSSVEIDAKNGAVKADKARVTDVKTGEALSFSRLDEALPWPLPKDVALALGIPGSAPLDDLSRYILKVDNLTAANYKLAVDGQDAGTFTRAQLAAGVNLSQNAGPINEQTAKLLTAILNKNNLFYNRWRAVQIAAIPAWIPQDTLETARATELARLDAQIAAAEKGINELRAPATHVWTLTPAA